VRTLILPFILSVPLLYAQAVEIIPGELSYEPPEFFNGYGPSSANPGVIREYLAKGNTYDNHRQLNFVMVPSDGEGGEAEMPDVAMLKKRLKAKLTSPRLRNLSEVGETVIGGKKALKVSYEVLIEDHPAKAVFAYELYWIPTTQNRVIQLTLSATPASQLESIRDSLKTVVLKELPKADPNAPLPGTQDKVSLGGGTRPGLSGMREAVGGRALLRYLFHGAVCHHGHLPDAERGKHLLPPADRGKETSQRLQEIRPGGDHRAVSSAEARGYQNAAGPARTGFQRVEGGRVKSLGEGGRGRGFPLGEEEYAGDREEGSLAGDEFSGFVRRDFGLKQHD
jgi:hypothetical protein